jgi:mannose-6-phosphate isomerase-like protein (cupin superfamily)
MHDVLSIPRPQPLWFIDTLAYVHLGGDETSGRYAVLESTAGFGNMAPLHIHEREDEVFYVLEGRLTLYLPGKRVVLNAGDSLRAPEGVPHTYRVESETARWLVVCQPAGFDAFVREVSDPAPADQLPPDDLQHDLTAIGAAAARHGIELLGPPGTLPENPQRPPGDSRAGDAGHARDAVTSRSQRHH